MGSFISFFWCFFFLLKKWTIIRYNNHEQEGLLIFFGPDYRKRNMPKRMAIAENLLCFSFLTCGELPRLGKVPQVLEHQQENEGKVRWILDKSIQILQLILHKFYIHIYIYIYIILYYILVYYIIIYILYYMYYMYYILYIEYYISYIYSTNNCSCI